MNEEYVWVRTDSRNYYVKDHLGSIRQTLNQSGSVMSAMDYYAFGGTMSSYVNGNTVDKYKFTGKERDLETGLDYFGARYYDSKICRWMSVDPLAEKYPGWSPYNYCANNPLNYFDPNGEDLKPTNGKSARNWYSTTKRLNKSQKGRALLKFYKRIPYDIPLEYTHVPGKTNAGGAINLIYSYDIDPKTQEKKYTEAKITKITLDDSQKGYNEISTAAEELSHGRKAVLNPNEYKNAADNATSYATNQNEIDGKKEAQEINKEVPSATSASARAARETTTEEKHQ